MIGGLLLDLRHAWRIYLKTPWQSALAVLTMATAMALVAGLASLWSELHLATPPGIEKPEGLVSIGRRAEPSRGTLSADQIRAFSESSETLEGLSGEPDLARLEATRLEDRTIEGFVGAVLPRYFELLQPRMAYGRGLEADDYTDDGARVLVLSHRLFEEHFEANPAIVGREVDLGEQRWRVVGVADPRFGGTGWRELLFWAPYNSYFRELQQGMPAELVDNFPMWRVFGRTRPGAGPAAVEAELEQHFADLPYPDRAMAPEASELMALAGLVDNPQAHRAAQRQVSILLAATLLIAVVAAVNVGIFLLARAPTRRRELALRRTVGATTRRLAGQLLHEAALLVAIGSALGVLASIWLAAVFRELRFLEGAEFNPAWVDLPALGVAAALALAVTLLVALLPVLGLGRQDLSQTSRQIGARAGVLQHTAGVLQLGLAGLVGAAALAFLVHLWLLAQRDLGLEPEGVTAVTVKFKERPGSGFEPPTDEASFSFREEIRQRIGNLPGVDAVSFGSPLPGQRMFAVTRFQIDGEMVLARMLNVAPGFLELLHIDLLHGRDFDSGSEPGMIITRAFAEQVWGTTDVVGRFLRTDESGQGDADSRIIGVIGDLRYDHPDKPAQPMVLSTSMGFAGFMSSILVRGEGEVDADQLRAEVDAALATHLDLLAVNEVQPLSRIVAELTARDRARAQVTALFAIVILGMAAFGFFALQRFLVDAGRRETAIRMALGAGPKSIRRHVLLRGLILGLPGLVIGGLLAVVITAWLHDDYILATISPIAISAATTAVLALVMILASAQPARSAARLQPGRLLQEG